ncbi:phage tail assembly chaperone [Endozoicomonas sp. SM1973]|uniref:Phage tail assembly chaperone n=1 Tax=Spartinivicinus marinus TaxID=2994442 RepID=A0A853IL00_9GAMM|nr:tail fiber assembly protein [Spartinivicinus marinus]MCX4025623.1 tail fiber assembly protein [Spartinivicinus marinus]NYZ70027.1 phage tail assembly chaperone [Spartinivicinus marinus]
MKFKIINYHRNTGSLDIELENGFKINIGLDSLIDEDNPTEQALIKAISRSLPEDAYFNRNIPEAPVISTMLNKLYNPVVTEDHSEISTWDIIRGHRNNLLRATDWTQMHDNKLSEELRKAWSSYRQKLRDIPQTNNEPQEVTWPIPPDTEGLDI